MPTYRTFDTVEEQRMGLNGVADNIEVFWLALLKKEGWGDSLDEAAATDAKCLRLIASKLKD